MTPCIRRLFFDSNENEEREERAMATREMEGLREMIGELQSQLEVEKQKASEAEQEKEAVMKERDSLYRVIAVYKEREKELEARDRRQKLSVANQVDELMLDNQRLQAKLDEAQGLLKYVLPSSIWTRTLTYQRNMGLEKRTPPPTPRAIVGPSTPHRAERPSIFSTPTSATRTVNSPGTPLSHLKGGLAIAREDLQARLRVSSTSPSKQSIFSGPSKSFSTLGSGGVSPLKSSFKLGDKRSRDPEDIDMLAASDDSEEDGDRTLTPGGSKRMVRLGSAGGRSVRRKYGVQ